MDAALGKEKGEKKKGRQPIWFSAAAPVDLPNRLPTLFPHPSAFLSGTV
jgi:hypothetical protein